MKQFFNGAVICIIALASCTTPFKKAKDGSQYKVISTKNGAKIVTGNIMELNFVAKYKDSILASTIEEGMPQYGLYDTTNFPIPFKEMFKNIHVGDSVVLRVSTDSILAKGQAAPFIKKGQFIYQFYTFTNAYATKEQADSAQKTHLKVAQERGRKKQLMQIEKMLTESKAEIDKDDKIIDDYLTKNNIKATKTPWGVYIAVQNEGTGQKLTAADFASVNYTGKTFDSSKVFDSNTDPKFKHQDPYDVNLGHFDGVILGWTDALLQMKKGTKATVYIPSTLGYGKQGNPQGGIQPNAILVFDMEVVDIIDEATAKAHQDLANKKQMEPQQKVMDSVKKTTPATPKPKK